MTTTHTFTTCFGDDDAPVTVTYTYSPAEPMTLEYPGCEAAVEISTIDCDVIVPEEWLIEQAWEHFWEQTA